MNESWKFFLALTIGCIVVQAFFSMVEMACVSYNKIRLQYYVSKKDKRAIRLSKLLNNPAQLFGTTLIGVNLMLQLGSEASRQFYMAIGYSADIAPLTQVFFVLVAAELAPMFAGRKYSEHVVMLGISIVYYCSLVLMPLNWFCDLICKVVYRLVGRSADTSITLTREELQKVLEEQEAFTSENKQDINNVVKNIFTLKSKTAKDLMQPMDNALMVPSSCTLGGMKEVLKERFVPYLPVFHKNRHNVVSIAYPRDLLRLPDEIRIREKGRVPWFITESTPVMQILKQFRRNNQSLAVVLNQSGLAIGFLSLDEILDEIFGETDNWMAFGETVPEIHSFFLDRTFSGSMKVVDFNKQYHAHLDPNDGETLEAVVQTHLGHMPEKGESIRIDKFMFTVEEAPLIGAKMIAVRSLAK